MKRPDLRELVKWAYEISPFMPALIMVATSRSLVPMVFSLTRINWCWTS